MQKPQMRTATNNPGQLGSGNHKNRNTNHARRNGNGQNCHEKCHYSKVKCFQCEGLGHMTWKCPSTPFNENWGEIVNTSNMPPGMYDQMEENQECQ